MDLFEAIRSRRSIRKYKPDPIPDKDIRAIIEAATLAPSASNAQMWRFLVVSNKDILNRMRDAIVAKLDELGAEPGSEADLSRTKAARNYSTFFPEAPVTIVVLGEPYHSMLDATMVEQGWTQAQISDLRQRPDIQSLGAAIQNICLSAHAMGYGTCWMTGPTIAGPEIEKVLDVQPPWKMIALIPVGIPDYDPPARPRRPLDEVLEFVK
jgi:nitroreductase